MRGSQGVVVNLRIRELAEQAEFSEKDLHIQGDNFQMFAELIVRECAGIIESQDVDPAFRHRMAWAVKQRFGFE
jgi:hypothetical protein